MLLVKIFISCQQLHILQLHKLPFTTAHFNNYYNCTNCDQLHVKISPGYYSFFIRKNTIIFQFITTVLKQGIKHINNKLYLLQDFV